MRAAKKTSLKFDFWNCLLLTSPILDYGIGAKLVPNWKKKMLYAKKRISMLTGFRNHFKIISRNRATVLTRRLSAFKISYLALSENAVDYCILSYHLQDVNPWKCKAFVFILLTQQFSSYFYFQYLTNNNSKAY